MVLNEAEVQQQLTQPMGALLCPMTEPRDEVERSDDNEISAKGTTEDAVENKGDGKPLSETSGTSAGDENKGKVGTSTSPDSSKQAGHTSAKSRKKNAKSKLAHAADYHSKSVRSQDSKRHERIQEERGNA